jgi:K+-transporting ATPase ATPase C chain
MKTLSKAIKLFIAMTILTGVIYPLAMLGISQLLFPEQANGSLLRVDGQLVGSELIAQKFTGESYFWPRPSAVDYNPQPSSGSNLGPTSKALQDQISERRTRLMEAHGGVEPPDELLLATGSGLDPEISPEAALYQVDRIVRARQLNSEQAERLRATVVASTQPRSWGFVGQPRVNVLRLNLKVDSLFKQADDGGE